MIYRVHCYALTGGEIMSMQDIRAIAISNKIDLAWLVETDNIHKLQR